MRTITSSVAVKSMPLDYEKTTYRSSEVANKDNDNGNATEEAEMRRGKKGVASLKPIQQRIPCVKLFVNINLLLS